MTEAIPLKILGIVGWSGAGKTTLIETLIPALHRLGVTVSTVKHAHHGFDMDRPGKDSFRHRAAGAHEVAVVAPDRWVVLHERRQEPEPTLDALIGRMAPVDLILVEGFKRYPQPKLEVHRPALGKPMLWPEDPSVVAVASDAALADTPLPVLPLNDADAIARFVVASLGLPIAHHP